MVRHIRHAFQEAMRAELVELIEELTGRKVIAAFSDTQVDPDVQLESFLLGADDAGAEPFTRA